MTEVTVKVNTRELTRQLNDLDLLQYQPNELKEFIKENLKVVEIGSSEDIRFYISLKKRESIEWLIMIVRRLLSYAGGI